LVLERTVPFLRSFREDQNCKIININCWEIFEANYQLSMKNAE
jgi:hypothetical protein